MSQQLIIEPSGQQLSVFEGETLLDSVIRDGCDVEKVRKSHFSKKLGM